MIKVIIDFYLSIYWKTVFLDTDICHPSPCNDNDICHQVGDQFECLQGLIKIKTISLIQLLVTNIKN